MIQIFLDGKLAVPKDNQTIKFTSENPFFTKSSSYTYDVELPLAIEANRAIFGNIQRMDISKEPRILEAVLIVDNVTILSGTAHITNISDTSVKVQLLGEAASYNYGNKMDETYIDEIDLGNWYMVTWPDGSHWKDGKWEYYPPDTKFKWTSDMIFSRIMYNDDGSIDTDKILDTIYNGTYPWVAFPVINSNADLVCNIYAERYTTEDHSVVKPFFRDYSGEITRRTTDNPAVVSTAIQPFVWIIAELIAKATGFNLAREDNALYTNSFFKRIFIVNANNMIECNKCLPHWTVNEFWSQLENTFGMVMSMDYSRKKMYLRQRSDHYRNAATTTYLRDVVDEYTVEVDDESEVDISVNNVGFADFDVDPADLLDEYITGNCDVNTDFDSITELLAWGKQNEDDLVNYKGTLFKCKDGRHFILSATDGFLEVNQFRPRISDESKEDIEVELKFVPARFIDGECTIYGYKTTSGSGHGGEYQDTPVASFPVQMLQIPDISDMSWYQKTGFSELNIDAILKEEEDEESTSEEKDDNIFLAIMGDNTFDNLTVDISFFDGAVAKDKKTRFPRPRIREKMKAALTDTGGTKEDSPYSLSLIPIDGQENLAKHTIENSAVISAKVRYCIKFVAERIPDPSSIFLIHNRRFVCEKIEADIAPQGLQKLMTGYFYEFEL